MADIRLGIKLQTDGAGNVTAELTNVDNAVNRLGKSVKSTSASVDNSRQSFEQYAIWIAKAHVALMGFQQAANSMKAVVDATAQMDRLRGMMEASSGSAAAAAESMKFVQQTSKTLGINLVSAADGFASLSAAARGTALQGQATRDIFTAVSKASAALGKSAEDTNSMINALSQMISKGTVSMEELRGQLGDRLPGAFQLAARAMGVTTQELDKIVSSGQVTAEQLLPKLAKALDDTYSNARFDRLNNNIARLDNAWTQFKGNIMDSEGMSMAIGSIASALESFGGNREVVTDKTSEKIKELRAELAELEKQMSKPWWLRPIEINVMAPGRIESIKKEISGLENRAKGLEMLQKQQNQRANIEPPKSALELAGLNEQKQKVAQMVVDTAKAYKVDPAFALAIAEQESGFNQLAKSAAGARGVMQLMPGTAKDLGVNFADLNDNIKGGVLYLSQQEKQFKSLRLAAAAYNAGPGNVQKFGGVPPFKETQNYVVSVGALYEKWRKVLGVQGDAFVSAKDQADELSNAFKSLETHHDAMVAAATLAAKEADASRQTQLQQIELERKAAEDAAKQTIATATTQQQKIAAVDQLRVAEESAAQRSKALIDERITTEQGLLEIKRAALADELANADRYNLTIVEQARLKQELLGIESQLRMVADTRAQAELQAASEQLQIDSQLRDMAKDRQDSQRQAEQAVADEQLRLNAAFANGVQQAQLFAQQASAAFGTVGESIGKMVVGVMQFSEQLYQIDRDRDNAIAKLNKSAMQGDISPEKQAEEIAKEQMKWADKSAQYQISMLGDITDASKGFFKEGSKGYKAMEMATKAFRMFEMAMAVKSMVLQVAGNASVLASDTARTGTEVANSAIRGQAKATEAVANQASGGDPYSAVARAAVMAAMMAAIGLAVAGAMGGGGGATARREDRQKTQGTGTVFGDAAAQSNSIANSLEIIRDNSSNDLNYSAAMLRSLENLSNSILALANQVTSIVMPSIDAAIQASGMQFGKQNISLFSGFNTQLTDSGIGWFEASLSRILKGDFTAKMYADITKSFEVMGSALSESTKTYVRDAGSEVSNQITMIFKEMVKALQDGASAFGLSSDDVLSALKGFKVGMEQISLKDMTMEEQTAALNAVFSKINDQMAARINKVKDLGLAPFRKAGEGMAETYYRVGSAINTARGAMEQLGLTVSEDFYKTLTNAAKQGAVDAEISKKTIIEQMGGLSEGVKAYIMQLEGSADDVAAATKQLIKASQDMRTAGFDENTLNRTMINAAGGLDAFNEAMASFNENFLSEADRYSGDVRNLTDQFARLGKDLPKSKEDFYNLVHSINVTDKAGQKLFGQMIALSDAFAKVADEAQRIKDKYADILNPFKKFSDQIKTVGEDFNTLLGGVTGSSQLNNIGAAAQKQRDALDAPWKNAQVSFWNKLKSVEELNKNLDDWQSQLDAELAKKPKNQNKNLIAKLRGWISDTSATVKWMQQGIGDAQKIIDDINSQIATINAQEIIDVAQETLRLENEKKAIIEDATRVMSETLIDVFDQIVQTVQAAQQRVQAVVDLQKQLASQMAQLQGPGAVARLAGNDLTQAWSDINSYIEGVRGGTARNVETEIGLLNTAQQAVMARYNAEIAAIQDAEREYIAAETERLNAALQAQIEAINAATDAAIQAESDRLEAAVKAQGKLDEAAQKAMQKDFDAQNKITQKQFDAEQKVLQKQFDAEQAALSKLHEAQLNALQDELDAANKLSDAIKGVAEYAQSLKLSANATLSPEARLAEAQRQYQTLVGQAQGGDAEAMGKLAGASDAYLEAAKSYYGSSTAYQSVFDGVQKAMEAIGGMSAPDPDSIQSRIDLLREAQAAEMEALRELQAEKLDLLREQQAERLDAIREIQSDQLDALREQQQANIDAMRESSQKVQEQIREAAQSQIEALQKQTQQAIADLSDPTKNRAMAEAKAAAERDLGRLYELAEKTRFEAQHQADDAKVAAALQAQKAWDLANAQLKKLDESARIGDATLSALNAILGNNGLTKITSPGVTPIPKFASGGLAQPGLAIVGEQGPELVRFNRPGQVYTASETKAMLGGDAETKQILREIQTETRAGVTVQSQALPLVIKELAELKAEFAQMKRNQKLAVNA